MTIAVSDMLAFIRAFAHLHQATDLQMHPTHAGTICTLLHACEAEVAVLQQQRRGPAEPAAVVSVENIIHVNFNRPAPPTGAA